MSSQQPQKPVTTYGRRRRSGSLAQNDDSSALELANELASAEISHSAMCQRMMKRARSETVRHAENNEPRSPKRFKQDRNCSVDMTDPAEPESMPEFMELEYLVPIKYNGSQYETPRPNRSGRSALSPSKRPSRSDSLSPVPAPRRGLSRTSSGNFKENSRRSSGYRRLASPFHSRPASTAASPKDQETSCKGKSAGRSKKIPYRMKARSLTNSFSEKGIREDKSRPRRKPTHTSSLASSPRPVKTNVPGHRKFPSGPCDVSVLAELGEDVWRIPAKVFTRATPSFLDPMSSPGQRGIQSPSNLLDGHPVAISTPPRRPLLNKTPDRNKTVNEGISRPSFSLPPTRALSPSPYGPYLVSNFPETGLHSVLPAPEVEDVAKQDEPQHSRNRTSFATVRARRRTMVRLSSDSIFSSSMAFSATASRVPGKETRNEKQTAALLGVDPEAHTNLPDEGTLATFSMDLTSIIGTSHTPTHTEGQIRSAIGSPSVLSSESMDMTSIIGSPSQQQRSANRHHASDDSTGKTTLPALLPAFIMPIPASSSASDPTSSSPLAHQQNPGDIMTSASPWQDNQPQTLGSSPLLGDIAIADNTSEKTVRALRQTKTISSSGHDELRELFSVLGLDEDARMNVDTDDYADVPLRIAPSISNPGLSLPTSQGQSRSSGEGRRRTRAGTIRASDYMRNVPDTSAKISTQGRARAGTIRASDFGQSGAGPSGSSHRSNSAMPSRPSNSHPASAAIRSRSGTITASARLAENTVPKQLKRPTARKIQGANKGKAKEEGPPTIKMRVEEKPLSPAKPGDPDDELLLIPRGWGWPHWDQ